DAIRIHGCPPMSCIRPRFSGLLRVARQWRDCCQRLPVRFFPANIAMRDESRRTSPLRQPWRNRSSLRWWPSKSPRIFLGGRKRPPTQDEGIRGHMLLLVICRRRRFIAVFFHVLLHALLVLAHDVGEL